MSHPKRTLQISAKKKPTFLMAPIVVCYPVKHKTTLSYEILNLKYSHFTRKRCCWMLHLQHDIKIKSLTQDQWKVWENNQEADVVNGVHKDSRIPQCLPKIWQLSTQNFTLRSNKRNPSNPSDVHFMSQDSVQHQLWNFIFRKFTISIQTNLFIIAMYVHKKPMTSLLLKFISNKIVMGLMERRAAQFEVLNSFIKEIFEIILSQNIKSLIKERSFVMVVIFILRVKVSLNDEF